MQHTRGRCTRAVPLYPCARLRALEWRIPNLREVQKLAVELALVIPHTLPVATFKCRPVQHPACRDILATQEQIATTAHEQPCDVEASRILTSGTQTQTLDQILQLSLPRLDLNVRHTHPRRIRNDSIDATFRKSSRRHLVRQIPRPNAITLLSTHRRQSGMHPMQRLSVRLRQHAGNTRRQAIPLMRAADDAAQLRTEVRRLRECSRYRNHRALRTLNLNIRGIRVPVGHDHPVQTSDRQSIALEYVQTLRVYPSAVRKRTHQCGACYRDGDGVNVNAIDQLDYYARLVMLVQVLLRHRIALQYPFRSVVQERTRTARRVEYPYPSQRITPAFQRRRDRPFAPRII